MLCSVEKCLECVKFRVKSFVVPTTRKINDIQKPNDSDNVKMDKEGKPVKKKKTFEKQKENNHFDFSYGKVKRQTLTQSTGE